MPVDPLKIGFVGGGVSSSIGPSHFSACNLDGRWSLVSGAFSSNSHNNLLTAKSWYISENRTYNNWQTFIEGESNKIDAVAVLLPTPNHFEVMIELIKSGIPIICEKPLVGNLSEANIIKSELEEREGFLAVTYNYSAYPMVRELRERINGGDFGAINKISIEMPQEIFLRTNPKTGKPLETQEWRLNDSEIPIICHDLGTHLYHLTKFLTNKKPLRTAGKFSNYSNHENLVDDILMWVEFEDDIIADFWMSKSALGHRNGLKIRIYGSLGSAEWVQNNPEYLILNYRNGDKIIIDRASNSNILGEKRYNRYKAGHPSGFLEAFANLYSDIADSLIEYKKLGVYNNPFVFGVDHSIESLLLFNALVEANKSKTWIKI